MKGCTLIIKNRGIGAALACASLLALVSAMPANAAQSEPAATTVTSVTTSTATPAFDEVKLRELLDKFDVPAAEQDSLIEVARDGDVWDVLIPGSIPVTTGEETEIDGFDDTISRFADGSVAASGVEIPHIADPNARGINSCSYTTGTGYLSATGCQIDGVWGTVVLGATAVNYTRNNGAAFDQITRNGSPFQRCLWPTTCSSPTLVASKAFENAAGPAHVRWQGDVSSSAGSWNAWVRLNVGGDSATTVTS